MAKPAAHVMPHCHIHTHVALICPACVSGRNKGVTSKAKAKSSARNGRLGGRPKLPKHSAKCDVNVTGRYTAGCKRCQYDNNKVETAIQAAADAGTLTFPRGGGGI